jgi:hypothetical protein
VLWNGTALRPSNVADLEAIDDSWQATSGTPARYIEDDDQGVRRVRVYPAPASPGTLTLIYFQVQAALSASQTSSPLCRALDSYLLLRTVEAARLKECKGAMPEVSQAITTIAEQVESAALALWK